MNKYLIILFALLGLVSCSEHNEAYYQSNPEILQKAMKSCPNIQPKGLTCEQLDGLAKRLAVLAYQLQSSPQAFGNKILSIQQSVAQLKLKLKQSDSDPQLKAELESNERELADCLAVVKWLESPES